MTAVAEAAPSRRAAMTTSVRLRRCVLLAATIATGLIAGFFYAYHVSVTRGLASVGDAAYVEAMTAINASVQNAQFAAAFFGAILLGVAALATHLLRPWTATSVLVATGVVLYVATLAITAGINVPLNDGLAVQAGTPGADLARVRAAYETAWNAANAARTATNLAAFVLLATALATTGPRSPASEDHGTASGRPLPTR